MRLALFCVVDTLLVMKVIHPTLGSNLLILFFSSISRIVRAELSRGAYVEYSLQLMPNLIAKDGGKNKIWDAGVDFDVGWKKLPFK
jgi:hypothetical protein